MSKSQFKDEEEIWSDSDTVSLKDPHLIMDWTFKPAVSFKENKK